MNAFFVNIHNFNYGIILQNHNLYKTLLGFFSKVGLQES
ncbi:hypothetical protein NPIRD3C_2084 [Nitrosopumilus piranensis]|uniref:Uncharacterized protein n=1 Tax=Nitrosopumilus piranensis TaxID=1582439 RepID=A0A0C5BY95_9ARCH|nr:hypothetical protein NPIRD3C_2084 [Nitrosopumilus piranensis]